MTSCFEEKIRLKIMEKIESLYGKKNLLKILEMLEKTISDFHKQHPELQKEKLEIPHDAILITYGDQIKEEKQPSLEIFEKWLKENLHDVFGTVHLLPFFPYSSDDGFSVIDFRKINPQLGDWKNIESLSKDFNLMFDAVINHISAKSSWFHSFLDNKKPYSDYFITKSPEENLSNVTRPRTSPLLHPFETKDGIKHVWTTFSEDQVDLNTANPDVLIEIIDLLLFYVSKGAKLIRLDAVSYFWKKENSTCINLDETHLCVQLFKDVMEAVAPSTLIVTETNVPHEENIAYLGNGSNEAQMVYQFALPPLIIDAIQTQNANYLSAWAEELKIPSDKTAFFNITATHDGNGVRGASDWLPKENIENIGNECVKRGGKVSYRALDDGSKIPYELNITFFDALTPANEDANDDMSIKRYITAQSVAFSLAGVPGIYFHSLFGTRNDYKGFDETKQPRSLNRRKFNLGELNEIMANEKSREMKIFKAYTKLIKLWKEEPAFNPTSSQKIVFLHSSIFSLYRAKETENPILAIHNFSKNHINIDTKEIKKTYGEATLLKDIITNKNIHLEDTMQIKPYETIWLKKN